ncbi:MAG: DUF4430 domain-containing protein [Clostridiales bacterium]|nr:DUF4430 domain-containing protein [Clostridiales bacterium]
MKKNRKLAILILIAVVAAMACAYIFLMPKGASGDKTIVFEIAGVPNPRSVTIKTDAAYLRGALEQEGLVAGDESEYGLFVKTVDGYTANESNQEWWCFTKGGESLTTGVDTTPIADGEHFEATLTVGY